MFRILLSKLSVAILAGVGMLATATPAEAAFRMRIDNNSNGQGVVFTDGLAPAANNPSAGVLSFTGANGAFTVIVATGTSQPPQNLNPGALHGLDLVGLSVSSATGGTMTMSLQLTGLSYSGVLGLLAHVGGTLTGANSSINFSLWANGANNFPAYGPDQYSFGAIGAIGGLPAGSVNAYGPGGVTINTAGSFSADGFVEFTSGGTYSLFLQAVITFGSGGGSASFDFLGSTFVPAPAGLVLFASAVPGLAFGVIRYRRKK